MELLESVTPYLEMFRGFVIKISDLIAGAFNLDASNVYIISLVFISIYLSKYLLEFFYTTLDGRKGYWVILTVVIFWVIRYLGG